MTRSKNASFTITRQSDSNESGDHWLKAFENQLQKTSVQAREPASVFDQINSIMNNTRSSFTSVQGVVDNMLERSGLKLYLDEIKQSEQGKSSKKIAQQIPVQHATSIESDNKTPQVIKNKPSISNTLKNLITESRGNLSVPAIISRLRSLHARDISNESDWDDEKLIR